ncbi:uncharacterized protein LOC117173710 [Belonocnema kinseyi]|uniref:uncharacterized protein LOC117173710 n=1 Tax=Belonocnema kinseyi TaxID=2817044 RepID=UPI00143D1430|nr:uncharacterized protein LOC117173710 [Belonocnema kinseyi]
MQSMIVLICIISLALARAQPKKPTTLEKKSVKDELETPISLLTVQGVAGQMATLPCDIQPSDSNDSVSMVLWFKEASGEPVFSSVVANPPLIKCIDLPSSTPNSM